MKVSVILMLINQCFSRAKKMVLFPISTRQEMGWFSKKEERIEYEERERKKEKENKEKKARAGERKKKKRT